MLLIHGLWFRSSVWTPWLPELDEAGYDAVTLSWRDKNELLRAARERIDTFPFLPIVIGHGVGGAVAERLLIEGNAAAAISLAPLPGGYPVIPTAARLLRRGTGLALLSMHGSAVVPTFPQFHRTIANVRNAADAQYLYERHVAAAAPRDVLLHALRDRVPARTRRLPRGPLLLATGGRDELIRETSTASLYRNYRRRQPDAVTDYKVFPGLDHTLSLGTDDTAVLFYCLDWLTAQNM
jgi:non-heme chloroperoxidase